MRTLHAPHTPRTPRTPGTVCRAVTEQTVGPFWVQARRVEPACSSRTASLAPRNGAPPRPDNPRTFDWSSQSVGDVNGARHGPRCAFPLRSSPHFLTKRPPALIPCHACRPSYPSHAPARFGSSLIPAVAIEPFQVFTRGALLPRFKVHIGVKGDFSFTDCFGLKAPFRLKAKTYSSWKTSTKGVMKASPRISWPGVRLLILVTFRSSFYTRPPWPHLPPRPPRLCCSTHPPTKISSSSRMKDILAWRY